MLNCILKFKRSLVLNLGGFYACCCRETITAHLLSFMFFLQVVSDPGGGAMFVSDPKKPVGGHVVS